MQVNIAACFLKLDKCQAAVDVCTEVLSTSPTHAKALYRRGMALSMLGQLDAALADLKHATEIKPEDASLAREFKSIKKQLSTEKKKEKTLAAKMLGISS